MTIELVSKKIHKFGGKLRRKGEKIFATEKEAQILKALGRAVPVEVAALAAPAVEDAPKRAYKRKEVQPEPVVAPVAAPEPVLPVEVLEPVAPMQPEARKSLIAEVEKVKDSFREQFSAGAAALGGTLHITKPKKKLAE